MPLVWKSQTDSHTSLEISHRTRDSHIPTAARLSFSKRGRRRRRRRTESGSVTDVSGPICYRSFRLRTRLLSATLCASAETADATKAESRGSLSANVHRVTGYADETRPRNLRGRCDGASNTPPRRGEMVALAPSPPPSPPHPCVRRFPKDADRRFAAQGRPGPPAALAGPQGCI